MSFEMETSFAFEEMNAKIFADFDASISMVSKNEMTEDELSNLLYLIEDNSRNINSLMKNKFNLVTSIQSEMKQRARLKASLTETQITSYQQFNDAYEKNAEVINSELQEIEANSLKQASKEIFKQNSNYSLIFSKLKETISSQMQVILKLYQIIGSANGVLAVL